MAAQHPNARQGALLAALFVRRPVLAFVLNVLVFIAGLSALGGLQVQELPTVSRPVLTVTTLYPGASATTVDQDITQVVEGAVSRVAGVVSVSSESRYGRGRTTVELSPSTDINVAASDVRNALSRVSRDLPSDAGQPEVVKADTNAQAVMRIAVTSKTMGLGPLTDLVNNQIIGQLRAVNGVADVQVYGDAADQVTVDINPDALAARGLTLADVTKALDTVGFTTPAGTLNATNQNIIVQATTALSSVAQVDAIDVKPNVPLSDVATVYFGPSTQGTRIRSEGTYGVGLGIIAQAQSNTIDISNGVRHALKLLKPSLPRGVNLTINSDDATFIKGAVSEVERTMLISIMIVVAIIFVFLRDWRTTLIPAISMPIAIGGALGGMYLAGFSINILTLLAMVMATGLVVDDAIVVLENIVRVKGQGNGPRAAAVLGTQEVYFAVLATSITLIAVFVPISFLPGRVGGLFREFGFTLAFAVAVSTFVALSLTPTMAARALAVGGNAGGDKTPRRASLIARIGTAFGKGYAWLLHRALEAPLVIIAAAIFFGFAAWAVYPTIKSELTPPEDRSFIAVIVQAPQNVSLDYTNAKLQEVANLIAPLKKEGLVRNTLAITGFGGNTNRGFMAVELVPKDRRKIGQQQIAAEINRGIHQIPGIRAFAVSPNSLHIRGGGQGLQFALVGPNFDVLAKASKIAVDTLSADSRFGFVRSSYDTSQAQVNVQIDRARADQLGVKISGLGATLQAMLNGTSIGSINLPGGTYPVYLQSTTQPINDTTDLRNIFVRTQDGRYIPMSSIVKITEVPAAPTLNREGQQRAVDITAGLSQDFTIGSAYTTALSVLGPKLPPGVGIVPLAEAATIGQDSHGMAMTFGVAGLVVLLVLAAQFESFISALIIMVTVPVGLAAAIFALVLTGGTINIYSEIGLVLLVGIMAKNGILVVEFANQLRDRGHSVREAIEQASMVRLRPILMTKLATILGALPLVLGSGPGSESRAAMGWVVVGALGFAAISTLFLTPATYLLFAPLSRARSHEKVRLEAELDDAVAHASDI